MAGASNSDRLFVTCPACGAAGPARTLERKGAYQVRERVYAMDIAEFPKRRGQRFDVVAVFEVLLHVGEGDYPRNHLTRWSASGRECAQGGDGGSGLRHAKALMRMKDGMIAAAVLPVAAALAPFRPQGSGLFCVARLR